MESVYLKTLVEVVKAGSLSRAAETLCVTQPAVSRRIKFLEEHYGRDLLDRTGAQIRPTEAGLLVARKAEALLEIEADLDACLHRLEGKTRISFASTQAFGIAHLPKILKEFMLACGDTAELRFTFLNPKELLQGMKEGLFDAAVLEGTDMLDPAFASYRLPEADTVFFSAPTLSIPSPEASIQTLLDKPLFTRAAGCCSRMLLDRGLRGLGLDLGAFKKVIILDDLHLLIQTVLEGNGVSFLPLDLLGEDMSAGRLNIHFVPGFQHARRRSLVVNQGSETRDPSTRLVEIVLSHFQRSLGVRVDVTEISDANAPVDSCRSVASAVPGCCLGTESDSAK